MNYLSIFFVASSLQASALSEYEAVDKTIPESLGSANSATLQLYTNGPPKLLFLTEQLPSSSKWLALANAVLRLDLLYEQKGGQQVYESCTATLIAPDKVITAEHCLPGDGTKKLIKAKVVNYKAVGGAVSVREVLSEPVTYSLELDISVLKLESSFDSSITPFPLNIRAPIKGETLVVVSHPLGQAKRLSSGGCVIGADDSPMESQFYHKCMTMPGSSGALLVSASDQAVIGVHSQAFELNSIGNSLLSLPGLASLGAVSVDAPTLINTLGWSLSPGVLKEGFINAVQNGKSQGWLGVMLHENTKPDELNKQQGLIQVAAEHDSVEALQQLLAVGVKLSPSEAGAILTSKVEGAAPAQRLKLIEFLLEYKPEIGLNSTTGDYIFCGPGVWGSVKQIFKEKGYGQSLCKI
jgi:hypothetical protein